MRDLKLHGAALPQAPAVWTASHVALSQAALSHAALSHAALSHAALPQAPVWTRLNVW